jgi:hypothetical protein
MLRRSEQLRAHELARLAARRGAHRLEGLVCIAHKHKVVCLAAMRNWRSPLSLTSCTTSACVSVPFPCTIIAFQEAVCHPAAGVPFQAAVAAAALEDKAALAALLAISARQAADCPATRAKASALVSAICAAVHASGARLGGRSGVAAAAVMPSILAVAAAAHATPRAAVSVNTPELAS